MPGADPLGELTSRIPELAPFTTSASTSAAGSASATASGTAPGGKPGTPGFARAVREAVTAWARRDTAASSEASASSGASDPSGLPARPVIIVDQFEEAFTLCPDEADRRLFIQLLHDASTPADPDPGTDGRPLPPPVLVVLGVRADFYEECLSHPELSDALQHRHMVLGPLSTSELREAVTGLGPGPWGWSWSPGWRS